MWWIWIHCFSDGNLEPRSPKLFAEGICPVAGWPLAISLTVVLLECYWKQQTQFSNPIARHDHHIIPYNHIYAKKIIRFHFSAHYIYFNRHQHLQTSAYMFAASGLAPHCSSKHPGDCHQWTRWRQRYYTADISVIQLFHWTCFCGFFLREESLEAVVPIYRGGE